MAEPGREFFVETDDGWRLSILERRPEGRARAAVLLGHAMMTNRRSLDRPRGAGLATCLTDAGFVTLALDVRGHGNSGPGAHEGADWSYDDLVLSDLPAAIEAVRLRHPDLPLAVLGHSLVGHVALAALGQRPELPVAAVVGLGVNVWMRRLEPSAGRWWRKRVTLGLMAAVAAVAGRFPTRLLRAGNEDEALSYAVQFNQFCQRDAWLSQDGSRDYLGGLAQVRVPVLAVAGAGDRLLCHPECSERFHRHLSNAPVWHWTARVGRFGLQYDPGHMQLATDRRSAPLWRAVAQWLRQRLGEDWSSGGGTFFDVEEK